MKVLVFYPLIFLVTWEIIPTADAGQTCASCSEVENQEPCQHHITCDNNEECYVYNYTTESGTDYQDFGCITTQACQHQIGPIIGKRSEGHHYKCMACCNETSLCNKQLTCHLTNTGSQLPLDCSDLSHPSRRTGIYTIYPYGAQAIPVSVLCEFDVNNIGWTVIQRRYDGSVTFYRDWNSYKKGFGACSGEYWIGNDVLHQLTSHVNMELKIVMSDFQNVIRYAGYSTFHVADEASEYRLSIGGYFGDAGDSMARQNGMKFSTFDRDNDASSTSCAQLYKGGWWYEDCHLSNLNGLYLSGPHSSYADGLEWYSWHGYHYSLKSSKMMIKKK